MTEMILASLSKIWHLIPIVIGIILLKKYLDYRDNQKKMMIHENHEKNGLTIDVRAKKKYEEMGYTLQETKENVQGIDFIMSKDDRTLLIQCNNNTQTKSITAEDILNFHKNAKAYVKENDMVGMNMELRYIIPFKNVLHKSAIQVFSNDHYGCKYVVV